MKIPEGSKIQIKQLKSGSVIIIPHGSGSILRYFIGLFILFWLGGWFFGFKSAATEVLSGKGGGFLFFWLAGWTVGGFFAAYFLYRVFRPSINESLTLLPFAIRYDSGIPPFQMHFGFTNQKEAWKSMFPKRTRIEIDKEQTKTLSLRETDSGNRLTVDVGAKRIDLAVGASEIEREWLFRVLKEKYS